MFKCKCFLHVDWARSSAIASYVINCYSYNERPVLGLIKLEEVRQVYSLPLGHESTKRTTPQPETRQLEKPRKSEQGKLQIPSTACNTPNRRHQHLDIAWPTSPSPHSLRTPPDRLYCRPQSTTKPFDGRLRNVKDNNGHNRQERTPLEQKEAEPNINHV